MYPLRMGTAQLLLLVLCMSGEHVEPTNLEWKNIMKKKIDLSLNRSLEELISSYWEAEGEALESNDYSALENYLQYVGAIGEGAYGHNRRII